MSQVEKIFPKKLILLLKPIICWLLVISCNLKRTTLDVSPLIDSNKKGVDTFYDTITHIRFVRIKGLEVYGWNIDSSKRFQKTNTSEILDLGGYY